MSAPADEQRILTSRRKWGMLITIAIYLLAAVVVYYTVDRAALDRALTLPLSVLLTLLLLSLANYVLRAWRWLYLSKHLNLKVPPSNNSLYYFAGYALTATPGKAGEAVRLWLLKSGHSVSYKQSLPLMLADRMVDLWATLMLVIISVSGFAAYVWHTAAMIALLVLVSIPVLYPRTLLPIFDVAQRIMPGKAHLIARAREVVHSITASITARAYGLTLLPSALGWFAEGAALYVVLRFFEADISVWSAVFVFSFSMIVGAISMLPGGLGSTEATMVLLLKALGVELDVALAATAIVRLTTFWFAVILGVSCTPAALNAARRAAQVAVPRAVEVR